MRFHSWMGAALYEPELGYYQRTDLPRWGRVGDYRTVPETSEVFGAVFAEYFARYWEELGRPTSWTIIEAGAGAGDFAHACLTFLETGHPEVFAATRYVIDEISVASLAQLKVRLAQFEGRVEFAPAADDDRGLTGIFFANEWLDAFPLTRVTRQGGKLFEQYVAVDADGRFVWEGVPLTETRALDYLRTGGIDLEDGQIIDICPLAAKIWAAEAKRFTNGFLVTVDYGEESTELFAPGRRVNGTLRAIADHQLQPDPLANPGRFDLTATVDWTRLRRAGETAGVVTVLDAPLDKFLLDGEVLKVAADLERSADPARLASLRLSMRELLLPVGMAGSFRVLVQRKS
jgi:SAM-dependent MidA family methyltransferase